MQRHVVPESLAGVDEGSHLLLAAELRVRRNVHRQGIVVPAALPVVDQHHFVQLRSPRRPRVRDVGKHLCEMPGGGVDDDLPERVPGTVGQRLVVGAGAAVSGRRGLRPVEEHIDEQILCGQVLHAPRVVGDRQSAPPGDRSPGSGVQDLDEGTVAHHREHQALALHPPRDAQSGYVAADPELPHTADAVGDRLPTTLYGDRWRDPDRARTGRQRRDRQRRLRRVSACHVSGELDRPEQGIGVWPRQSPAIGEPSVRPSILEDGSIAHQSHRRLAIPAASRGHTAFRGGAHPGEGKWRRCGALDHLWRIAAQDKLAVSPERVVVAGVITWAGVGLEPNRCGLAPKGGQVKLEGLPLRIGAVRVEQWLSVHEDPERGAVGLLDIAGGHRGRAAQSDVLHPGQGEGELMEGDAGATAPRAVHEDGLPPLLLSHRVVGDTGLLG